MVDSSPSSSAYSSFVDVHQSEEPLLSGGSAEYGKRNKARRLLSYITKENAKWLLGSEISYVTQQNQNLLL
jgi:hypothetical protein